MKKLILLIIILISCYGIKAQSTYYKLIDTNKVWNNIGTNPPWEYTLYYKFSSDTVLGGITYHWLKESTDSINWIKSALIREDTILKKVFLYGYSNGVFTGGEGLIYDFSANVGDTIALFNTVFCLDTCKIFITSIDSVTIGNQYRKRFFSTVLGYSYQIFWIEGIGAENGLYNMGYNYSCMVGGYFPRLVCYHENDTLIYVNPFYSQCFTTILNIKENKDQVKFEIESKGNNTFKISADEHLKEISIFNITGQKIVNIHCNNDEVEFSLSIFPKGVYFIKILTVNNKEKFKKIIKL